MNDRTSDTPDLEGIAHIGQYLSERVIPSHFRRSFAARYVGANERSFSRLLNGRARLSRRMALRIAEKHKIDHHELLDIQARLAERSGAGISRLDLLPEACPPALRHIEAELIEGWAGEEGAPSKLGELVRRLVLSTCGDFRYFVRVHPRMHDGSAYDIESESGAYWVPEGESVWQMGNGANPGEDAERLYSGLLEQIAPEDRSQRSFVFQTARRWPERDAWAEERRNSGDWTDVRAFDCDDLEQWIEHSAPVQVWLSERLGAPVDGYRSLERCWRDWSADAEPALSARLFASAIDAHAGEMRRWAKLPYRPMIVEAGSGDEALAFLSCMAEDERFRNARWPSQAVVLETVESARRLADMNLTNLVAVSFKQGVQREIGPRLCDARHHIFARPRSVPGSGARIVLDPADRDDFMESLREMGIKEERADDLYRRSAGSPTSLRCLLSSAPRRLAAMALAGSWCPDSEADREAVRLLTRFDDYEAVEYEINRLLALEDPPVWSLAPESGEGTRLNARQTDQGGAIYTIVSRLDCLLENGRRLGSGEVDNFLLLAENLLARDYSTELRAGACETLAILAAHGEVVLARPEPDLEGRIRRSVRSLIGMADIEGLRSLDKGLPALAEAAPGEFLDALEKDLGSESPAALQLLAEDPHPSTHFDSKQSGLLVDLERLAGKPEHPQRAVNILVALSSTGLPANSSKLVSSILSRTPDLIAEHDENSLSSLIRLRDGFSHDEMDTLWNLIEEWLAGSPGRSARVKVGHALMELSPPDGAGPTLRSTLERIFPDDPATLHTWTFVYNQRLLVQRRISRIFKESGPDDSEKRIEAEMVSSLRAIWDAGGFERVCFLIEGDSSRARSAGQVIPLALTEPEQMATFVRACVERTSGDLASDLAHCLRAAIDGADPSHVERFAADVRNALGEEGLFCLLTCAPVSGAAVRLIETMDVEHQAEYWREMKPDSSGLDAAEVNHLVDRLIEADRPGEALIAIGTRCIAVETRRLIRLLEAAAAAILKGDSHWTGYAGRKAVPAFEELNGRTDVTIQEKAELELTFASSLRGTEYGMPNLEIHIDHHPDAFVELVRLTYGKGESSETSSTEDVAKEVRQEAAKYALATVHRVPGTRADGSVDGGRLKSWMEEVYSQFGGSGREETLMAHRAARQVGELLSGAPADPDGSWPCLPVCEAIEWQEPSRLGINIVEGWEFSGGAVRRLEDFGYGSQAIAGFKYHQRGELGKMCCDNAKRMASEFPKTSEALKSIADRYEHGH